jgi:hypothetical protein
MWLVRAATIKELRAKRGLGATGASADTGTSSTEPARGNVPEHGGGSRETEPVDVRVPATIAGVTIHVRAVPGSKVREVVKVAVLPLNAASPDVDVELTIRAEGGLAGIPRETLNLVVLEGLRQLGLHDVHVETRDQE